MTLGSHLPDGPSAGLSPCIRCCAYHASFQQVYARGECFAQCLSRASLLFPLWTDANRNTDMPHGTLSNSLLSLALFPSFRFPTPGSEEFSTFSSFPSSAQRCFLYTRYAGAHFRAHLVVYLPLLHPLLHPKWTRNISMELNASFPLAAGRSRSSQHPQILPTTH